MLTVAGEPGLGKTTLVDTFLDGLEGVPIGRGRCSERLAGTEAYLPVLESLESLVSSSAAHGPLLERLAPSWRAQLSGTAGPGHSQEQLKREFLSFLQQVSEPNRLILFVEDVHSRRAAPL